MCWSADFAAGESICSKAAPGTGKTTIAAQFLLEGARQGEPGLYITLSETEEELRETAIVARLGLRSI